MFINMAQGEMKKSRGKVFTTRDPSLFYVLNGVVGALRALLTKYRLSTSKSIGSR